MKNIIDINEVRTRQNPVYYTVHYAHDKNGFSFTCEGIQNDPESNKRLAHYMQKAAEFLLQAGGECGGDKNH